MFKATAVVVEANAVAAAGAAVKARTLWCLAEDNHTRFALVWHCREDLLVRIFFYGNT
jgi:hypothetical protein